MHGPSSVTVSRVFIEWCLRREAPRWPPSFFRLAVLLPVLLTGAFVAVSWLRFHKTGMGASAFRELFFAAILVIVFGGAQFASRAICWEISSEMREIVRLTSINPQVLLWVTTLSRWWTIGWSLLYLLPLAALGITFGGVTSWQLIAGGWALSLVGALTFGFGMLAGVLNANSKNPEKSSTGMTMMGLVLYNMLFVFASQAIYWGNWLVAGYGAPSLDRLCKRISYSAPTVSLWNALVSPILFTPTSPEYWLHFLPAIASATLATLLVDFQFRREVSGTDIRRSTWTNWFRRSKSSNKVFETMSSEDISRNETGPQLAPQRPRCSEHPFFWKDVYILGGERGWLSLWTMFYVAATIGVIVLDFYTRDDRDGIIIAIVGILSIVIAPCIVSVRFDGLLTAEFRDRTWGSLMLLPVDPCSLLRIKLWATLWEQRFVLLPVGTAMMALLCFGRVEAVYIAGAASVMAPLGCLFLCQMSCINQLLGKAWWVGPCQAMGFVLILIALISVWGFNGPLRGFLLAASLLSALLLAVQYGLVHRLARNWVEP